MNVKEKRMFLEKEKAISVTYRADMAFL